MIGTLRVNSLPYIFQELRQVPGVPGLYHYSGEPLEVDTFNIEIRPTDLNEPINEDDLGLMVGACFEPRGTSIFLSSNVKIFSIIVSFVALCPNQQLWSC